MPEESIRIDALGAPLNVRHVHQLISAVSAIVVSPAPVLIMPSGQDGFLRILLMQIAGNWRDDRELDPYARVEQVIISDSLPPTQIRVECDAVSGVIFNLLAL